MTDQLKLFSTNPEAADEAEGMPTAQAPLPADTPPPVLPPAATGPADDIPSPADYAARRGWDMKTAERWLAPALAYDPRETSAAVPVA